ncbi:MAG: hypothetical protein IKP68_10350 [Clostridia bacterium]|nr:hypothetical protein [Clostridia bacterium]
MKTSNKLIILACIITVAIILCVIVFAVSTPRTEPEETTVDITATEQTTQDPIPSIELPNAVPTTTAEKYISSDPRISVDENGGVHIDVGATTDSVVANTPHISGEAFVSTTSEGVDAD